MKAIIFTFLILTYFRSTSQVGITTSKSPEYEPCLREILESEKVQIYLAPFETFLHTYPTEESHEFTISILFSAFDTLRAHNFNKEADCFINQISKIYEYYDNREGLFLALFISGNHSLIYLKDDIQALNKLERALSFCNDELVTDTACLSIVNSLNVLYEKLDLQSLKKYQPGQELEQAMLLNTQARYTEALKILDSIQVDKLPAEEIDHYLYTQIVTRMFLGLDVSSYEKELVEFLAQSNGLSMWSEGALGLICQLNGELEKSLEHFDLAYNICVGLTGKEHTSSRSLETLYPCEIFSGMKGMALNSLQQTEVAQQYLQKFIFNENLPESNRVTAAINLGDLYLKDGKVDSAIYYLNFAEQLTNMNKVKSAMDVDNIYYLKAKIAEFNVNNESALFFWKQKVAFKQLNNIDLRLAQDYIKIADLYISTLRFDSASTIISKMDSIIQYYSPGELIQYINVKTKFLIEQRDYKAVIDLIEAYKKNWSNHKASSAAYRTDVINLKLYLLEAYTIVGRKDDAEVLFNEFESKILIDDKELLRDNQLSFVYGLGYILATKFKVALDTTVLKSLFYIHAKNKRYAVYRGPYVLINSLGANSGLFYDGYMIELIQGIAWIERNGYMKEFEKEYADKIFYLFIHSKQIFKVVLDDNIANYFLTSKSQRTHNRKWINTIANLCDRMNSSGLLQPDRNVTLSQMIDQYTFSRYSYPNETLPGKLVQGEALIKIIRNVIDGKASYAAGILQHDVLILLDLGVIDEERISREFSEYLNVGSPSINRFLYRHLWEKIDSSIAGATKVTLIPDGVYYFVNLNTLKGPNGDYLIERYQYINYLYGVQGLTKLNVSISNDQVILIGDPSFSSTQGNGTFSAAKEFAQRNTSESSNWIELPETRNEILEVQEQLEEYNCAVFLGSLANEDMWRGIKHPKILHLATHGFSNTNKAYENSGFAIANANDSHTNTDIDGYIYESDISQMDFSLTELVTLSMCESGMGSISSTGISSLSSAFIEAGAENVMYSVSKVDDTATREFMKRFYTYYRNTRSPIYAISNTIREMKLLYEKPVYWGAFIMITTNK